MNSNDENSLSLFPISKALHKLYLNTKINHPLKITLTRYKKPLKQKCYTLFKKIALKRRPYNLIHTSPLSLVAS